MMPKQPHKRQVTTTTSVIIGEYRREEMPGSPSSLLALPTELLERIAIHLPKGGLTNLRLANSTLATKTTYLFSKKYLQNLRMQLTASNIKHLRRVLTSSSFKPTVRTFVVEQPANTVATDARIHRIISLVHSMQHLHRLSFSITKANAIPNGDPGVLPAEKLFTAISGVVLPQLEVLHVAGNCSELRLTPFRATDLTALVRANAESLKEIRFHTITLRAEEWQTLLSELNGVLAPDCTLHVSIPTGFRPYFSYLASSSGWKVAELMMSVIDRRPLEHTSELRFLERVIEGDMPILQPFRWDAGGARRWLPIVNDDFDSWLGELRDKVEMAGAVR